MSYGNLRNLKKNISPSIAFIDFISDLATPVSSESSFAEHHHPILHKFAHWDGIPTYIYQKSMANVGKYSIYGAYRVYIVYNYIIQNFEYFFLSSFFLIFVVVIFLFAKHFYSWYLMIIMTATSSYKNNMWHISCVLPTVESFSSTTTTTTHQQHDHHHHCCRHHQQQHDNMIIIITTTMTANHDHT